MKVIASKQGYHGALRAPGDVFDVPEGQRATWFDPAAAQEEKKPPKREKPEPPLA